MSHDIQAHPINAAATLSAEQRFLHYARTGDMGTIQALIKEYANRSYNQARRVIGREEGTEDAVQDAYVRLVATAKRYDGSVPFAAWLGRLVSAAAIDSRRRMLRHKNVSDINDRREAAMHDNATQTSETDQPEHEALRTALDSLPDRYRTPLTMHYLCGLSQSETAAALGIPARTVETQLGRGLDRLRGMLVRTGFAVTSAGLVTMFSSLPSYSASPTFITSLTATKRLAAVGRRVSERVLVAKKTSGIAGIGLIKAAVVGVLAVAAVATWSMPTKSAPVGAIMSTQVQSPFGGAPWAIPGIIEIENYDLGGEGIAYHDDDEFNMGEAYRADGVDICDTPELLDVSRASPFIGWTRVGEWLEYTVDVARAGDYTVEMSVSSVNSRGTFHVEFDGVDKSGPLTMPVASRGALVWQTLGKTGVSLNAGTQVMKIVLDSKDNPAELEVGNLDFIRLVAEKSP
jgi:RNA polymerase sigma factor (sigma-70 family)